MGSRAPFRWRRANPIGAAALLVSHKGLLGLALIVFLAQFAGASFNSIFQFYTHFRFNWGPPQVAVLLMVLSGGNILMMSLVTAGMLGEPLATAPPPITWILPQSTS